MHVSIVGTSGDSKPAARDSGAASIPVDQMTRILRLIEEIAGAPNRITAVEELIAAIAIRFPNALVRAGIGGKQMKRFYDRRLGWLGTTSTLRRSTEANWDSLPLTDAGCHATEKGVVVSLPDMSGERRLIVWIEGDEVTESSTDWLLGCQTTLRVVFWGRPARTWTALLEKLGITSALWVSVIVSMLLLIAVWPAHYRIACTAKVEPVHQRLVATPFEATLLDAFVKPGDAVRAGQVLVVLDGRPLRLELESIESEILQASQQNNQSRATGKIAEAQQAALKVRQLSRRRDLISDRLKRLQVVSPIDGVVVSGELQRYIGSPLKTGQTLVEVAPLDRMVIEVEIPEHEIAYVTEESESKINITAVGGPSIEASLDELYPSAEIRDDRNVFIGRIEVENSNSKLRPGMQGKATTYGPLRPLAWSWVRGAWERIVWWLGY